MIKVLYKTLNDRICSFEIKGHGNYAAYGQDVVCAAASLAAIGMINAINELVQERNCRIDMQENKISVEVTDVYDGELQTILKTVQVQLKCLEEEFPKNIMINTMEV